MFGNIIHQDEVSDDVRRNMESMSLSQDRKNREYLAETYPGIELKPGIVYTFNNTQSLISLIKLRKALVSYKNDHTWKDIVKVGNVHPGQ